MQIIKIIICFFTYKVLIYQHFFWSRNLSFQKSTNSIVIRYFHKERILVNLININRYKAIIWLYSN